MYSTLSEDSFNEKVVGWFKYINGETRHATHTLTHTHTQTYI